MADASRTRVDKLVLHHAVTPLWSEKSKAELAQWFSDNGFARAYGSNHGNWSGLINPYTGGRSYSQAHLAGQRVDGSTPDATDAERAAGYRLVPLIQDIWGQITWHAGNWAVNQSSIGIENLGDYRNYALRDGDCKVIADFWRPTDSAFNGATGVYGHQEIYATACPARIMEGRGQVVHYINNPPQVAPTPAPTPVPPVVAPPTPNVQKYEAMPKATYVFKRDANLWNFDHDNQKNFVAVKPFKAGDKIDIVGKAIYKTGSEYYMTAHSFGDFLTSGKPKATTGINKVDLDIVRETVITTSEESKTEVVAFSSTKVTDHTLPMGEEKITQVGVNGERTIVYTVTYTDGKETSRLVKSDAVTTEPTAETISVGAYVAPTPSTDPVEPTQPVDTTNNQILELLKKLLAFFGIK